MRRIFRSLAGPRLEDPDPARRLRALESCEPPLAADALVRMAREDSDPEVRAACILRINEALPLIALMDLAETRACAQSRLERLLSDGYDLKALLADLRDVASICQLLDAAPAEVAPEVLACIADEDRLAEIAVHHRFAAIRAAAVERVAGEVALRHIVRNARERDKAVTRRARVRLDALQDARAARTGASRRLEQLAAEGALLARNDQIPHHSERLALLRQQREEAVSTLTNTARVLARFHCDLPEPPPALAGLDASLAAIDARLAAACAEEVARRAAEAAKEAHKTRLADLVSDLDLLWERVNTGISEGSGVTAGQGQLSAGLELAEAQWAAATELNQAPPDLEVRRAARRDRLDALAAALSAWADVSEAPAAEPVPEPGPLPRTGAEAICYWARRAQLQARLALLDGWLQQCAWPEDCALPEPLARVTAERAAVMAARAALDGAEQHLHLRIGKLTRHMELALSAQRLGALRRMRLALNRLLATLPELDERTSRRVQALEQRIEELGDWEQFATAPKREALCEAMEKLAATDDMDAGQRAGEVKALRTEWNSLGSSRDGMSAALAKRFDTAAARAFAPAQEQFAARAKRQAGNTARRRRLCEDLEQFLEGYDWQAVNWHAAERIYHSARKEWRRLEDVDKDGHALGKRYYELIQMLKQRLEQRWQQNITRKEALVKAAQALVVDQAPVPAAASQVKALQKSWEDLDITPRSVNRQLWQDFRAACDAVFTAMTQVRDEARNAHVAVRAQLEDATQRYAEALAALRSREGHTLQAEDFGSLGEAALRNAMAALAQGEDAPRSEAKATDKALHHAQKLLAEARRLRHAQQESARCMSLRLALEHDIACVKAEVQGVAVPDAPANFKANWCEALARRMEAPPDDEVRRAACIDLELACGCESPTGDAALRLQRQVALLNVQLGGRRSFEADQARIEEAIAVLLACPGMGDQSLALAHRALAALGALE